MRGANNKKEKLAKPPGFNPNNKRDEARAKSRQDKKEAKEKKFKQRERALRIQVTKEVTVKV